MATHGHGVRVWAGPFFGNLLIGLLLLGAGWFSADAGSSIAILGPLTAAFAPDVFLAGLCFLAIAAIIPFTDNTRVAWALVALVTVLAGLNTRIPTFIFDLVAGGSRTQILAEYHAAVGQPIHIVDDAGGVLSARRDPYSHVEPACRGDDCLMTQGFRTAYPGIESDYWHERVVDGALRAGFSQARPEEQAPTLTVAQQADGTLSHVHIELLDPQRKPLARFDGRYRVGIRGETPDGIGTSDIGRGARLEYLLHGNVANRLVARFIRASRPYPLASFLKSAASLSHPQGATLGLIPRGPVLPAAPSQPEELEVLEVKEYDPAWVMKGNDEWSRLSSPGERETRCETLMRPEVPGAALDTWYLFVNDPTGRRKVKRTVSRICDPEAVWFVDFVTERGRTVLTKYRVDGTLAYRVSFRNPPEYGGSRGGLLIPTFSVRDGYLYFEWWNTNQSGYDRVIRRSMKVRLKEPTGDA